MSFIHKLIIIYTPGLRCRTGPAKNERKMGGKWAENIAGIHKHVVGKTAEWMNSTMEDGVPRLSFLPKFCTNTADMGGQLAQFRPNRRSVLPGRDLKFSKRAASIQIFSRFRKSFDWLLLGSIAYDLSFKVFDSTCSNVYVKMCQKQHTRPVLDTCGYFNFVIIYEYIANAVVCISY